MEAGWRVSNVGSKRLPERIGFEIMGKRSAEENREGTVIVIWQCAGHVMKEDTIYKDNEM
jgi:hypothetical protein